MEFWYSHALTEASSVYWPVKSLHLFLGKMKFAIVTDHETLKVPYHPTQSLAKSSFTIVQLQNVAFISSDYHAIHQSV